MSSYLCAGTGTDLVLQTPEDYYRLGFIILNRYRYPRINITDINRVWVASHVPLR
jgi:hypothetical protein